jgi:hypothetical protein
MAERYAPQRIQTAERPLHQFDGDPGQGCDWRTGQLSHCRCGFPRGNRIHDERALADATSQLQETLAEERRRLGEVD